MLKALNDKLPTPTIRLADTESFATQELDGEFVDFQPLRSDSRILKAHSPQ